MPYYNETYSATAQVTYGVYGLVAGVWTHLGSQTAYFYQGSNTQGLVTMSQQSQITVQSTANITAFRVVLESVEEGQNGAVTAVPNATWTSQTSSGSRTITESVPATIRPN
jgi:hypothetical protein